MTSQAWTYLIIGVAILVAAYQTQAGWLFVMGGGTLGVLILSALIARVAGTGVRLRALDPGPAWAGGVVALPVVLENDAPWRAPAIQVLVPAKPLRFPLLFKFWRDALVPEGWAAATATVPARGRADVWLHLPAPRRGEFPLPRLLRQSTWPLGLIAAVRGFEPGRSYLVFPAGPRLTDAAWLTAALARQGASTRTLPGHGQLLRGVREYRAGDALRQIHWRTTARLGNLHVKESEREAGEDLVIWLDLRTSSHDAASLEHMVTVAASIVAFARDAGRTIRLATQDDAEPEAGGRAGDPALVWLALVRAVAGDAPATGPEGALALSPVALPGWRTWASALVLCPTTPLPGVDATAICPVNEDIIACIAAGRLAP